MLDQQPTSGWSLAQALERTADQEALRRPPLTGATPPGPDARLAELDKSVRARRLFPVGPAGGVVLTIPEWTKLNILDVERHAAGAIRVEEIRFLPLLLLPDAAQHLAGKSLGDAFRRAVLQDPELQAILARANTAAHASSDGLFTYRRVEWPADIETWDLAAEWIRDSDTAPRDWITVAPLDTGKRKTVPGKVEPDLLRAGQIVADRVLRFLMLLRTGALVAQSDDGSDIPAEIWTDPFVRINFLKGILMEDHDGTLVARHRGLTVSVPNTRPTTTEVNELPSAPFTAAEAATTRTLAAALEQLVFNHPKVQHLRGKAKAAVEAAGRPFYDNAGLLSPVHGHEEELLALKNCAPRERMSHQEYKKLVENSTYDLPLHPDVYYEFTDEVELRACTLAGMLSSGELEADCYTAAMKTREALLPTIWTREEYYVLPRTGDIFEAKPFKMVPRWTGVFLRLPPTVPAVQAAPDVLRGAASSGATPPDADISAKKGAPPKALISAETQCRKWLVAQMWPSLNERPMPKREFLTVAQQKFVGLTERAFDRAWGKAIEETGSKWNEGGAPKKKPPHLNHRTN